MEEDRGSLKISIGKSTRKRPLDVDGRKILEYI